MYVSERVDILGVGFDNVTMSEAVDLAASFIAEGGKHYTVTPNAEILYDCRRDAALHAFISGANMVLPDSAGVMLGAKLLGTPLREKVSGVEFAGELAKRLAADGSTLFLLGAKPGVAERAAEKLCEIAPGLKIAGTRNGFFREASDAVREINVVAPDVLYVCLGSPRQEDFVRQNLAKLDVKLAVGLGGTLDIYAGEIKRAPPWMRDNGLEWLYRLSKQPSRIGRMTRLPRFVLAVLKYKRERKTEMTT